MKVLITNFMLATRTGIEIYTRDLALGLLRRGHTPVIYSPFLGQLAQEVREATIPVVKDLDALGAPPDIIHGHHHVETMTALLRFPGVPAIYFCHDWFNWLDSPPPFPRLLRYVAVDQPCYEKLVFEHGVTEDRVRLLLNFVDVGRFKPRPALPAIPRRALLFSSYTEDGPYLSAIRDACEGAGLTLDVVGLRMGNATTEPEKLLGQYDVVFAKGRSALEALAVGCAVIVYCARSLGPVVTSDNLSRLLPLNFGIRAMDYCASPDTLGQGVARELGRYDSRDAAAVSRQVRSLSHSEAALDEIITLYEEVVAEHRERPGFDAEAEGRAAAAYLLWLSLRTKEMFDVFNDSAAIRLKRRIVEIPVLGKLSHSVARLLAGPQPR